MNDIITYRFKVSGRVGESDLIAMSPLKIKEIRVDSGSASFTVYTDQSGLIGMIRYLNGLGLILLSVTCEDCESQPDMVRGQVCIAAPIGVADVVAGHDKRLKRLASEVKAKTSRKIIEDCEEYENNEEH